MSSRSRRDATKGANKTARTYEKQRITQNSIRATQEKMGRINDYRRHHGITPYQAMRARELAKRRRRAGRSVQDAPADTTD